MKLGRAAPENSDMIKKAELVSASRRSTARTTSRRWRHCHCCGQRSAGSALLPSSKSALPASPDVLAAGASEAGTLPAAFVRDLSQATQSTASNAITAMRLNMHCSSKTGPRRVSGVRLFWAVTVSIVVIDPWTTTAHQGRCRQKGCLAPGIKGAAGAGYQGLAAAGAHHPHAGYGCV